MYVRNYLMLLIFGCSTCGLTALAILSYTNHYQEMAAARVSNGALALRDLTRIESGFSQWILLSDLVIGSDESYLTDGAIRLSDELIEVVRQIRGEAPRTTLDSIDTIESFVSRQRERLETARRLGDDNRMATLDRLLNDMDAESPACIQAIASVRLELESELVKYNSDYQNLVKHRTAAIAFLLLGFFLCVIILWRWIGRMLSQPLFQLSQETHQARKEQRQVNVVTRGPIEVQTLSRSFSSLVDSLTEQIEEHRRTRAERERLNHELIDASRKAGMAEVASEVLHNVGNVLNSINVSATVISKQLDQSALDRLFKVNEMLEANEADLPNYLANDERGKLLPKAIGCLAKVLGDEQETQRQELKLLHDSISHVRKVIHNQQAFARVATFTESVSVAEIIEEAIRINGEALVESNINIDRDFDTALVIESDRHKIQQILVNLISNAADAVAVNGRNERVIKIAAKIQLQELCVLVMDNGAGIAAEKLDKIFSHGFTTKKHGHGFGLHSSANAAKVLGGSLSAESAGIGRGATFSLMIPMTTESGDQEPTHISSSVGLPCNNHQNQGFTGESFISNQ